MRLLLAVACAAAVAAQTSGTYWLNASDLHQVMLGVGFEIQSDSIGSGNNGLPESNSSVPNDLTPAEAQRFFTEMLSGFRFCRLALGLYFRGLNAEQNRIIERWPGQAAGLAQMAAVAGLEGFEVEYWSPAPAFKSNGQYIDGSLASFNASFLDTFGDAVVADLQYLDANGIKPSWWGLQNEPPVGPAGCIYSCCGYSGPEYYAAFASVAPKVRSAFPNAVIHADSWSGQHSASLVAGDPTTAALVDAWTFHRVGDDSSEQITQQAYFLNGTLGKAVLSNEYEYLSGPASPARCINTAQTIMNWAALEDAPTFFWLHALKPIQNTEASGYGLGFWRGPNATLPANVSVDEGHWIYNDYNWNSLAGFAKLVPWNSVRVGVVENVTRLDQRILAFKFDPARALWKLAPGQAPPPLEEPARDTLRNPTRARAAATNLGIVLTNAYVENDYTYTIYLNGLSSASARDAAAMTFTGHLYGPNVTNAPLGSISPSADGQGRLYLNITVPVQSIAFWLQE